MFLRRRAQPVTHPPLRGVNLGGWLVLERWITPSLFDGTEAGDEYTLCRTEGAGVQDRIRRHRDSFITRDDFVWLKEHGIAAVRLPVGYWTFGGEAPYLSTIEYVDKAFQWAAETGIYILLDMHAAPGSQNGEDHSGRAGVCAWAGDERNIIKTLEVVNKLVKRYARHPRLLGIELLNEPKWTVPKRTLLRYYTAAYKMIRQIAGPNVWVVFSDTAPHWRWKRALRGKAYDRVLLDVHLYQAYQKGDKKLDLAGHIIKTLRKVPKAMAKMRRRRPIIVGEWSLALDPRSLKGLDKAQLDTAWQAYGAAQLLTYYQSSAWFYWTYRTEKQYDAWNFRASVEQGWLPDFAAQTDEKADNAPKSPPEHD